MVCQKNIINRHASISLMETLITNLICSIGIGISLVLTIALFSKKKLHLFLFGLLFLSFFLQLTEEWLWVNNLIKKTLPLIEVSEFAIFIPAPALYLYAKYQTQESFQIKDYFHFLPVLFVLINFSFLYFAEETTKLCYANNKLNISSASYCGEVLLNLIPVKEKYLDIVNIAQLVIYIILALPILREIPQQKAKKLEDEYINWTKVLSQLVILAIVLIIIDVFWIETKFDTFSIMYLTFISGFISIYLIRGSLFMGINQRTNSYSKLSTKEIESIYNEVCQHLLKDNAYLNSNISLSTIAQSINIPRNKIKYALEKKDYNFRDLLNDHRIKKAKELLVSSPQLTIEAIGNEVGYSSKATFYKYFKKATGITPNEFLNQL